LIDRTPSPQVHGRAAHPKADEARRTGTEVEKAGEGV